MLWTALLFIAFCQIITAQDCSRSYEEPCTTSAGDIQDGDGIWPQKHVVSKRALSNVVSHLWPDDIIYYSLDTQFTETDKRTILEAMIDWEKHTCIRFIEREHPSGYVAIKLSQNGCCSYIGRVGCRQGLSLSRSCFSRGTVSHELGHVMGMFHEQSRPDRDSYVSVLTENIIPGALYNFNKLPADIIDSLNVPYDYNSIMHYSPIAYSKTGYSYTILARTPGITVGAGQCPSKLDFVQINKLYSCDTSNFPSLSTQLPSEPALPQLPYPNCGSIFNSSVNISRGFAHNLDCQWIIVIPNGFEMSLSLRVSVESSEGERCVKDYVQVHSYGRWSDRYCSEREIRSDEKISNTIVMIHYHTDSSNSYNGAFSGLNVLAVMNDIDECSSGVSSCSHSCHNTIGSYVCSCPEGMYLSCDQETCFDINECIDNNGGCKYNCTNIGRRHTCSCTDGQNCCRDGYVLSSDGSKCIVSRVNECANKSLHNCSQFCVDTTLSYSCKCKRGYELSSDNVTCVDINECSTFIRPEHHCSNCINFEGDFLCLCAQGYEYGPDLHTCIDINECTAGSHGCSHYCHNTDGSYTCSCPSGWTLAADSRTCIDINECTAGSHGCSHYCHNTDGSYTCSCPTGWTLAADSRTCIDINECTAGSHGCSHYCHNTDGSYTCSCPSGWTLAADSRTCIDINECTAGFHSCSHNCSNTNGSYTCSCPSTGWTLATNNITCIDINECTAGSHNCSHNCSNTDGSYTCSCPTGWTLSANQYTCTAPLPTVSLTNSAGYIYLNNTSIVYKIRIPDSTKVIRLSFLSLNVSCTANSFVEFFNGHEPNSSISIGKSCGIKPPHEPVISSIHELSITYISASPSDEKAVLQYTSVNSTTDVKSCLALVNNKQRFALSSFPNKYSQVVNCKFYVLSASPQITLHLLYTDLDFGNCLNDGLTVHNSFDTSQHIGAACNAQGDTVFTSNTYFMFVYYRGSTLNKYRGFEGYITIP